jgi:hypothetical protein
MTLYHPSQLDFCLPFPLLLLLLLSCIASHRIMLYRILGERSMSSVSKPQPSAMPGLSFPIQFHSTAHAYTLVISSPLPVALAPNAASLLLRVHNPPPSFDRPWIWYRALILLVLQDGDMENI